MFPLADTMRFCHQLDYATSGVLVITNPLTVLAYHFFQIPYSILVFFFWALILALLSSLRFGLILGWLQMLFQSNSVKGLCCHTTTTTTEHIPSTLLFLTQFIPCPTTMDLSPFIAPPSTAVQPPYSFREVLI